MTLETASKLRSFLESPEFSEFLVTYNSYRAEAVDKLLNLKHTSPAYAQEVAFFKGLLAGMDQIQTIREDAARIQLMALKKQQEAMSAKRS